MKIVFQRERFQALEDQVHKLFEQREFSKDISNSIVDFLHATHKQEGVDVLSDLPDVPFEEAHDEVRLALMEEFDFQ